ncbi:hypothetical protein [Shimazuella kribbensis]|uniref:hypothetical protein n=1 Tax=Shimazuella kribbensis TaxID=139808 RepID=UPI00040E36BB|nr:hypothetical protein [Shimazuella kribbensis]
MTAQEVIHSFIEYLHIPITNRKDLKQDQTAFQEQALEQLLRFAVENPTHLDEILANIAQVLPLELDVYKKGLATLICGSLIEFGGNPKIIVQAIVEQLEKHLTATEAFLALIEKEGLDSESLSSNDLDLLFNRNQDAVKASITASFVVLATMTSICRVKEARFELRQNGPLIQQVIRLEDDVDNLYYLRQVIHSVDDLEMIVLHPESQTGLKIKADMVQNNFHFFTLLQDQFVEQFRLHPSFTSFIRNEAAIQIAKGEEMPEQNQQLQDHALFGFYDYGALNDEGQLLESVPVGNWLFGEGTLHHVPKYNGVPVVLLGENMLGGRSWDVSFCIPVHEALKPSIEIVEVFSPEQVHSQIQQMIADIRSMNA